MNGYKTGGDWTDVTSIGRNEVVFEGRHKDYGAFYIRQRYPKALLFALLSAIAFVGLCAFIPYLFRGISKLQPKPIDKGYVIIPIEPIVKPKTLPQVPHPPVQPPKTTPNRFMPPVITPEHVDSNPIRPDEHTITSVGNPGTGNNIPDLTPTPPEGNPLPPVPEDNKIRTWVNEMPKFPGGDIEKYLTNQINYPPEEAQTGVQGIVYASFVIEKDGSVSNVKLERGLANGPGLNHEALRVLSEMPKWSPGKQDGHPVRIQYVIPIHFKLQ